MKYLCILFLFLAQTAFSQVPIPSFPCYRQFYKSTNEYGIDFYTDDWRKTVTDSMDLYTMKKGVSTVEGKVILLPIYDDIVIVNDLKDSCLIEIPYAIVSLNEEQFVVNLETGVKTRSHKSILYDDHQFFYRDLKIWGVYDLDFKLLIKDLPGISGTNGDPTDLEICDMCTTGEFAFANGFTLEFKNNLKAEGIEIDFPKVVLYQLQNYATTEKEQVKIEKWQKKHPTEPWDKEKLGLVDLTSGKKITPRFDEIQARLLNDQIYYWCYNYSWKYPFAKKHNLVIYDKHLKEVFQYENDFLPRSNLETDVPNPSENMELYYQLHEFEPRQNVYLIKDQNGKLGAINASGKLVVPFIYDSVSYRGEEKYLYKIWTNGQFHWLTNDGTQLMDGLDAISMRSMSNEIHYYILQDSLTGSASIVDPLRNLKEENFNEYYKFWPHTESHFLKFSHWDRIHEAYLVKKDNKLFYSMNDQFYAVDSTTCYFDEETRLILGNIVNKAGEILYQGTDLYKIENSCYVDFSDGSAVRLISLDGNQTMDLDNARDVSPDPHTISDRAAYVRISYRDKQVRIFNTRTWKWEDK